MPAAEPDLCGDGGGDTCGGDGGGEAEEDAAGAWALGFAVFRRAAAAAAGTPPPRIAIVALATRSHVLLARLHGLPALPAALAAVLGDPRVVKVGLGAVLEASRLAREWGGAVLSHVVDLEELGSHDAAAAAAGAGGGGGGSSSGGGGGGGGDAAPARGAAGAARGGGRRAPLPAALARLARGDVPGLPPWRNKAVTLSDWEAAAPSRSQQVHAALDAWAAHDALLALRLRAAFVRAAAERGNALLLPSSPPARVTDASVWHGWPASVVPLTLCETAAGGGGGGGGGGVEPDDAWGHLTSDAAALFGRVRATPADEALRARVRARVGAAVAPDDPSRVVLFGSSVNGLLLASASDADLVLLPESEGGGVGKVARAERAADSLSTAKNALLAAGFSSVLAIRRTKVPILKFVDTASGLECDLCGGGDNTLAMHNSAMLRVYCEVDARVRPLIIIVKHWAKSRSINSPSTGTLSSYAYAIMVLAYLQCVDCVPVLQCPTLRSRVPPGAVSSARVGGHVAAFVRDARAAAAAWDRPAPRAPTAAAASMGALLVGFMAHYAAGAPAHGGPVDISGGAAGRVAAASGSAAGDGGGGLRILDPFERDRDLARVLSRDGRSAVTEEFARAHALLAARGREPGALAALCDPLHRAAAAGGGEWTVIR